VTATLVSSDRLETLFDRLGVERAHVLACMSGDWGEFVTRCPGRICSLTVVAPHLNKGVPEALGAFAAPGLVIAGDQGAPAKRARDLAARFGRGELFELCGCATPAWADTVADRTEDVAKAIGEFLARAEREGRAPSAAIAKGEGEIAGISYRIEGQGPALVLMPLSLAPSQWDPLVPRLADRYTVIRLSGPYLGVVSLLEDRAKSGYGDLVAHLLDQTRLAPGETVLEVGCGSGALVRPLAKRLGRENAIVAADLNPYLISEARALARSEGLADTIEFQQANAEALPFADARFDMAYCCTVMEEGDADRMVAEMARVVRPGGRIAILTRATDVDWWVNLALPRDLKRKIDALGPATGAGVGDLGCADSSLYTRVIKAGLTLMMMGPQFSVYRGGERLDDVLDRLTAALPEDEGRLCRAAIVQARADGVLFAAEPFHCAVATR
jgi:SAM-dependent methyltransferase